MLKKKIYLLPRQNLFLNGSKLRLKGSKSIKLVLIRRIVRFYRRKLRKINIKTIFPRFKTKNLKYKFKLLKLKKRSSRFKISTLTDIKFFSQGLNMNRVIRRGKSRLKLRRTKKYYWQILKHSFSRIIGFSLLKYYKLSRIRYLNRFFRRSLRRYKVNFFKKSFIPTLRLSDVNLVSTYIDRISAQPDPTEYYNEFIFSNFHTSLRQYKSNLNNLKSKFSNQLFEKLIKLTLKPLTINQFTKSNKPVSIHSKYKTSFILSTIGFIFMQNTSTQLDHNTKSRLNRFRYSFIFKKDLKRYLLKKPGKLKLLSSSTLFTNYKKKYSRFGKPFVSSFFSQKTNELSNDLMLSNTNNILTSQNPFFSYKNTRKYNSYLGSFFKKEVRIKRIKFKPGYSRIWRNARETINMSLGLNSRYQYRLTRHLHRIKHLSKQTQSYIYDLMLKNVLINSRFASDKSTALLFVSNGLVFVNGNQTSNPNLNLFQNDFVQIIVNLKYYIIFKWLLNWNASKRIRLRKLSKTKFKKFKIMANKQRSRNLPDWILTSRLKSFDIPKYLEVDFFTLSSFILYEPFMLNDVNSLNFLESRSEIVNVYNWKYIN